MFALERIAEHIHRAVLPPLESMQGPWLEPVAVHIVSGPSPLLIDTGLSSSRPSLVAALDACGVRPEAVHRILLTSMGPASTGNLTLFPDAVLLCGDEDSVTQGWGLHPAQLIRERFESVLAELGHCGHVDRDEAASDLEVVMRLLDSGSIPRERILALPDGAEVASPQGTFRQLAAPGTELNSSAWWHEETGALFGGRMLVFDESFPLWNVRQTLDSLDRLSQLQPRLILGTRGPVERDFRAVFRSLGLLFHGALSHLPYAFSGRTSAVALAVRDLGGDNNSPMNLAARTLRYQALLEELHGSGILERDGSGPGALYSGGSAQGSRTAALLQDLEHRRRNGRSSTGTPKGRN